MYKDRKFVITDGVVFIFDLFCLKLYVYCLDGYLRFILINIILVLKKLVKTKQQAFFK